METAREEELEVSHPSYIGKHLLLCIGSNIICLLTWYLGTDSYVGGWTERWEMLGTHSGRVALLCPYFPSEAVS